MKCVNCGTDFEGNFCPNCGTKRLDEQKCPNCGAVLSGADNFCTVCGFRLNHAEQSAQPQAAQTAQPQAATAAGIRLPALSEQLKQKLYCMFRYVPAALFALFAVLLFAFFSAPVAVMPAQEFLGESIPAESYGNVYSMVSEFPSLKGSLVTLIIFAVFALILAAAMVAQHFVPRMQNMSIAVSGKKMTLEAIFACAAGVFYFLFFIVGCVVCGKINAADEGMEIVSAGACPVLLIVFSLLFGIFTAGAFAAKRFIDKKYPDFAREADEALQKAARKKQEKAEQAAAAYRASTPPPSAPEAVESPANTPEYRAVKAARKYIYFKRLFSLTFWIPFVYGICIMLLVPISNPMSDITRFVTIPCIVVAVFLCLYLPLALRPLKKIPPKKLKKRGGMVTVNIFLLLIALFAIAGGVINLYSMIQSEYEYDYGDLYYPLLIIAAGILYLIFFIVSVVCTNKLRKKVLTLFYNTPKPAKGQQPVIDYESAYQAIIAPVKKYRAYKRANAVYAWQKRRYEKAKPYEHVPEAVITLRMCRIPISVTAAALAAVIILISVLVPVLTNIFRIGKVERIELGYTRQQVTAILGEPHEADENTYYWYEDSVSGKLKEIQEKEQQLESVEDFSQLESLAGELDKLYAELEDIRYNFIMVRFGGETDSVTEVYFDTSHAYSDSPYPAERKAASDVNIQGFSDLKGYTTETSEGVFEFKITSGMEENAFYRAYFADGSYYMRALEHYTSSYSDESKQLTVVWSDSIAEGSYEKAFPATAEYTIDLQGALTLPEGVTQIGDEQFKDNTYITAVVIPDSVTSIGESAFSGCINIITATMPAIAINYIPQDNLQTVTITSGESIGYAAFDGCSNLTSITIPDSVTSIGNAAFRDCSSLTSITIPDSVTSIGDYAFYSCSSLTSVNIPDGVTSIGENAFYGCSSLTGVTIPDGVTSIGRDAFSGCTGLESITLPFVGAQKGGTSDTHFGYIFGAWSYSYNEDYVPASLKEVIITGGDSIGDYAFRDCSSLTSITIPDSVTSIGDSAFFGCNSLTSVTIPDSVTSIGDSAFSGCSSLTSVTIPDGVTSIGRYAFEGCSSLTSVTIGNGVTSIDENAFYNCSSLEGVYITDIAAWCAIDFYHSYSNPLSYAGNLYLNGELVTELVIPEGVTRIGDYAFYGCNILASITIGNGVTSIGNAAFRDCSSLTSITIGNGVTSIGYDAFYDCSSLTSITIPDSVTFIGSGAFYGCTGLESITLPFVGAQKGGTSDTHFGYIFGAQWSSSYNGIYVPASLKEVIITGGDSIGDYAFRDCSSLTSITIPDSVTSIGSYAFSGCDNIKQIENGVSYVDKWVIACDDSATSVDLRDDTVGIADRAFSGCSSLTSITIPDSVTSIGEYAFEDYSNLEGVYITDIAAWCAIDFYGYDSNPLYYAHNLYLNGELVTNLVIPEGVTSIGESAFSGCSNLTSVTIPDGVTSIGGAAFSGCSSLTSITIPDSVTSIGSSAFSGCDNIIQIENSVSYVDKWVIGCDDSATSVELRADTVGIAGSAFSGCSSLESITIPDSVTSIGDYAFRGCTSLTSITIPDSVTNIGDYAFYFCTSLTSITIPDSVTSIGEFAFASCKNIKTLQLSDSLQSIGNNAFAASGLVNIVIPESVTVIEEETFYNCSSLTSITIPDSVTSIGSSTFYNCSSLETVYYAGSEEDWQKIEIGYSNEYLTGAEIIYNYGG